VSNATIKECFDPRNSPMCMLGKKDAQQAAADFYESLEFFSANGGFTAEAFADFFAMVSGVHEEDYEFGLMTTAAFGL